MSGHNINECYVDGQWVLLDSSEGKLYRNYDPNDHVVPIPTEDGMQPGIVVGRAADYRAMGIWSSTDLRGYGLQALAEMSEPDITQALAAYAPTALEPVLHPLDEAALQAKTTAIRYYRSQISTFWGDADEMARQVRTDAAVTGQGLPGEAGQLAEREWRVKA